MKMRVKQPSAAEIAKAKSWSTWTCEPSTFPWHYDQKEICYVLEGEVEVEDMEGNTIAFGAGDWVEFDADLSCTWKVKKFIKKHYSFE
jgi:Predicted enzyme of the cupin superfamily